MRALVVTSPFGPYRFSEMITDPDTIEKIIGSEHAGHVVATTVPDTEPLMAEQTQQA